MRWLSILTFVATLSACGGPSVEEICDDTFRLEELVRSKTVACADVSIESGDRAQCIERGQTCTEDQLAYSASALEILIDCVEEAPACASGGDTSWLTTYFLPCGVRVQSELGDPPGDMTGCATPVPSM